MLPRVGLILGAFVWAQGGVRIGEWGMYSCNLFVVAVGYTPGYVWGLSTEGVFVVEEEGMRYRELSRVSGLHENVPTALYTTAQGLVFLGYKDGMVQYGRAPEDLQSWGDLAASQFYTARRIWSFAAWGDSLAMATDFGVVVWHIRRREALSTIVQLPGRPFASPVRKVLWSPEGLWAMTEGGVFLLPNGRSWQNGWQKVSGPTQGLPDTLWTAWAYTPHGVLSAWKDTLYRWENGNWAPFWPIEFTLRGRILGLFGNDKVWAISSTDTFANYIGPGGTIRRLWNPASPALWCSSDLRVLVLGSGWNAGATIAIGENILQTVQHAQLMEGRATHVLPTDKGLWFIHGGAGFWGDGYGRSLTFYPHGAAAGKLLSTADIGGRSSTLHRALAKDGAGIWVAANTGLLYISQTEPFPITYYTPYEVPEWDGLFPDTNGKPTYLGFSALHVDQYGYLWAGKLWGQYNLWVRTPQGQWLRLPYQDGSVRQIIEDRRGYKWVLYQNGFLRVISDNGSPENISGYRSQLYTPGNGPLAGLPNTNLRCIAADRNNALWIGTDRGVAVLYGDPFTGNLSLSLPVIDNRYLLEEESITAIAVDGQNRKWFGTLSSGIYITNPEGTRQIAAFSSANSPLPSNYIYSIRPWDLTGETFIVTSEGIVSYRDWATEPSESLDTLHIFPNPVRRNYDGLVGIRGLSEGSTVRIFTVDGQLVRYLMAFGGQAVWDLQTIDGRRVSPGVYLISALDAEGQRAVVGKIVILD
jgi:hypothetical protein